MWSVNDGFTNNLQGFIIKWMIHKYFIAFYNSLNNAKIYYSILFFSKIFQKKMIYTCCSVVDSYH